MSSPVGAAYIVRKPRSLFHAYADDTQVHLHFDPKNAASLSVALVRLEALPWRAEALGAWEQTVTITGNLSWDARVDEIHAKASQRLCFLQLLQRASVDSRSILAIHTPVIRSLVEYACPAWHTGLTAALSHKLEGIQRGVLRLAFPDLSYNEALACSNLSTLHSCRETLSRHAFVDMLSPGHKLHPDAYQFRGPVYTTITGSHSSRPSEPNMKGLRSLLSLMDSSTGSQSDYAELAVICCNITSSIDMELVLLNLLLV